MGLFAEPLPSLLIPAGRVLLHPPRRGDYRAWAVLRDLSRDFLVPWEPQWPDDALTQGAYRRRLKRMAQDWREDSGYAFHIFRRDDHALLGGISISHIRRGVAQIGSVGYWIGQPHARQGYMTEALLAAIHHGFRELGLHRLEAACLPRNIASQTLLQRCGFQQEGLARRYLRINGAWEDHLQFGMLSEEWSRG